MRLRMLSEYMKRDKLKFIRTSGSIIVFLILWQIVFKLKLINPLFFPAPVGTLKEGFAVMVSDSFIRDVLSSFGRIFIGLFLAVGAGIPAGFLIGYYAAVYNYAHWIIDFSRSIPPILVFPLCLLIFGTGNLSRIAVIFFGCVFILMMHTAKGMMNIPVIRIHAAKTIGAKARHIFLNVILYESLPGIFIGIRTSLSMAIIVGLVTEMLVGTRYGLGSRIVYAQTSYATEEMYFIIILVGTMGFLMNHILVLAEKKIIHWNGQKN